MSQAQTEPQQATTVPAQQPEKEQPKKYTGYRVEEEKIIEINKLHATNRREKARVMQLITIGLFGRRRYRNTYLVSSLNNFYPAIMIANTLQKRVERLALVIRMDKVKYTEFAEEGAQGVEKQYSTFTIKITREPTEEDRQHPGFNPGLEKIQNPLTEIIKGRDQRRGGDRRRQGDRRRRNQPRREGQRRQGREDRRRQERDTVENRRPQRRYEQKNNNQSGKRRTERQTRNQDRRDNRDTRENRDNRRENREVRDNRERRIQQRVPQRSYQREDRRNGPRRDRDDQQFDRRPRGFRENKQERVEEDNNYRRGEKKTRGGVRNEGRVAEHGYNPAHMNRTTRDQQDRQDRAPQRGKNNRYQSDDQY